jgi:hypothetical protein
MKVEKNRTGRAVRRVLIEGVVRDQHEFLTDLSVPQTLTARVPGLLIGYVCRSAAPAKFVCRSGVDCDESKRIHAMIVRTTKFLG